jgi:DNA-binding transcriptional MocR family regulator
MLGSSDVYVLAGAVSSNGKAPTLRQLASTLHVDHTLVHRALKRAEVAGLYRAESGAVNLANFEELMIHGVRFIAPVELGALVPGVPAAWAADPISGIIRQSKDEPPPVWPSAQGRVRGQALEPLHPAAVAASEDTPGLARLLAIVDSLRAGDVRVRKLAAGTLRQTLRNTSRLRRSAA